MQRAPHGEIPCRAVPQPADQHRDHEIDVPPDWSAPVAAQWNVKIIAQKVRQRDVPTRPELHDAGRFVRRSEVDRQANAEQQRQSDRHVRIAGEIEVDLKCIGERAAPTIDETGSRAATLAEHGVGKRRDAVRDDDFFEQPDGNDRHPDTDEQLVDGDRQISKLRNRRPVVENGAGHEVGKVADEQEIVGSAQGCRLTVRSVDEKGDLGKGIKRNSDRQRDTGVGERDAGGRRDVFHDETRVLEIAEQREIECDAEPHHDAGRALAPEPARVLDAPSGAEIHRRRKKQEPRQRRLIPAVEDIRGGRQPNDERSRPARPPQHREYRERDGQEQENKNCRVEEHRRFQRIAAASTTAGRQIFRRPAATICSFHFSRATESAERFFVNGTTLIFIVAVAIRGVWRQRL